MNGWPLPELLVVAKGVETYHTGARQSLPRGIVIGAGRILRLVDPDDRETRHRLVDCALLDLGDAVILPGFFDAHNHQPTAARDVGEVMTAHVRSLAELRQELAQAASQAPVGTWITTEHCLTLSQLDMASFPVATDLDDVTREHPVAVRFGAHTMALNSRALDASGIAALAEGPAGGVVDRDPATCSPTGVIHEYGATQLVLRQLAGRPPTDLVAAMRRVQRQYCQQGLTSVRVTGLRPREASLYQTLLQVDGRLANRVFGGPRIDPTWPTEEKLSAIAAWEPGTGFGNEWFSYDAVKIFVDGGVETLVDGEPHLFLGPEELQLLVSTGVRAGWSVTCHAVSEEAVDLVLDAYQTVARLAPPWCRLVLEHGFFATEQQLRRTASLGVWLSTQPGIASVEGPMFVSGMGGHRFGQMCKLATARRAGVRCALGSDWNATPGTTARPFSPLDSIAVATTRMTAYGDSFGPQEALEIDDAIYLHTRAPAELVGVGDLGGIWPGARADLVALSDSPQDGVAGLSVLTVLVGGAVQA